MSAPPPVEPAAPPAARGAASAHRFGMPLALVLVVAAVLATPLAGPAGAGPGLPRTVVYGRDRAEMVLIPAGPFWMGSAHGDEDEAPPGRVDLPAYYIDRCEVTNGQFLEFLNSLPRQRRKMSALWIGQKRTTDIVVGRDDRYQVPPGLERHPVRHVSWHGAMAFARWAGKELPTEAQWEKAARGVDGRIYPWGDLWHARRASSYGVPDGVAMVAPVGAFPLGASPYGLLDMGGNMWEWTRSLYRPYPYREDDGRNDPAAAGPRVVRGGSYIYNSPEWTTRASDRYSDLPTYSDDDYGLRCVVEAERVRDAMPGGSVR